MSERKREVRFHQPDEATARYDYLGRYIEREEIWRVFESPVNKEAKDE